MKCAHVFLALPLLGLALAGCSHPLAAQAATDKATLPNPKGTLKHLETKDIKVGNGGTFGQMRPVTNGDHVFIRYTGKLANGTVFDSNEGSGKKVFDFAVGEHQAIVGMEQGVLGMKVGGERMISIPASMGYGDKAAGSIPADSDLFFDVKLVDDVPFGQESDVTPDDTKVGSGPEVKKGDQVTIRYTVNDLDGNLVDSDNGQNFTWKYGSGEVFPSLEVGLQGMRQGGTRMIHINPAVMFRHVGKNSMLTPPTVQIVKVELLKVVPSG